MAYLIAMLVTGGLFVGFLLLTRVEFARGVRYFEASRSRFDLKARKIEFIMQHVDWGALIRHATRTFLEESAHDIAHRSLLLVRSIERFLNRVVRALSMRRQGMLPPHEANSRNKSILNVERLKHGFRSKVLPVQPEEEK